MMDLSIHEPKGPVTLAFQGDEERGGRECRRYSIDGPGLEERGGTLWVARGSDPCIVAYEIDLPDEPGMDSGRLELVEVRRMGAEAWDALVAGERP